MPQNIYINLIDSQSGLPKIFDPAWVSQDGISWVYQQQGGLAQIEVELGVAFEQTTASAGDYLEVWVVGESAPRARGIVSIPESDLALLENTKLTAYGRMADMDKTLLYQVFLAPVGSNQDLSWYAAQVLSHYQTRKAQSAAYAPNLVQDIESIGINLESLTCSPSTARAAMDTIYNQAAGTIVWGWDIDPESGCDRFYLRLRTSAVAQQFFVGDSVSILSSPAELDQLVNAVLFQGGAAKYPNLVTNASFEQPINPSSDSGGILLNGGFEAPDPPTDDNAGFSNNAEYWTFSSSASRNYHDPSTNHNFSPHTGDWCLLLDGTVSIPDTSNPLDSSNSLYGSGDWAYQDVALAMPSGGASLQLIATLYAAQEYGTAPLAEGVLFLIGLDSSHNPTGETFALPVVPQSTAWSGGAASSVVGADAFQLLATFTKSNTAYVRCYLASTVTSSEAGGHGVLFDDCTLALIGSVGQYAWGTHVENPGSAANQFTGIIWGSAASAWDGAYGVRATVVADPNNKPALCPAGDTNDSGYNWNSQFHFKPTPQQALICAWRVRMLPGGGAGSATAEYREWASDGHQTQFQAATATIPDDGLWHVVSISISAHGDVDTAMTQLTFDAAGTYDIDGASARDANSAEGKLIATLANGSSDTSQQSPATALYIRGTNFEQYVDVTTPGVAASLSPAAATSITTWGRREAILSNEQIIDWTPDAQAILAAYFNRAAVLLRRPRVTLVDQWQAVPLPGDATQIQISGTGADIDPQWCSKATYTWHQAMLAINLEMSDERPTLAKLLLNAASGNGNATSGGSTVGAPSGGGQTGATTATQASLMQADTFTVSGTSYTLSQTPDGDYVALFGDGIEQDASCFALSGTALTITCAVTDWEAIDFKYSYQPESS